jgi:hypothetical protein
MTAAAKCAGVDAAPLAEVFALRSVKSMPRYEALHDVFARFYGVVEAASQYVDRAKTA